MLYIAWKKDEPDSVFRKPTRKERVEALAAHLMEKWERADRIAAEKKYGIKFAASDCCESMASTMTNHKSGLDYMWRVVQYHIIEYALETGTPAG